MPIYLDDVKVWQYKLVGDRWHLPGGLTDPAYKGLEGVVALLAGCFLGVPMIVGEVAWNFFSFAPFRLKDDAVQWKERVIKYGQLGLCLLLTPALIVAALLCLCMAPIAPSFGAAVLGRFPLMEFFNECSNSKPDAVEIFLKKH